MVTWIVGLAGAGKSTIGAALCKQWRGQHVPVVLVDGETIRRIFGETLGYSMSERRVVADRLWRVCSFLEGEGVWVVCTASGLFQDVLDRNRNTYARYCEVFIDVPIAEIIARDQHGLYSGALKGMTPGVVGVDIPFAPPANPDIILANGEPFESPDELARRIRLATDSMSC